MAGISKIAGGEWIDLNSIAERRLVFLLPGALAYYLSGNWLDAAIAVYCLFYVGLSALSYLVIRAFDPRLAALAAMVCALCPLLYQFAGALLPDVISAFMAALMLVLLMRWLDFKRVSGTSTGLLLALGAVAAGGAALKESNAIISVLPFAVVGIRSLTSGGFAFSLRQVCLLAIGALLFFGVEAIAYKTFSGQWHLGVLNSAGAHGFKGYLAVQGHLPGERLKFLYGILDIWTIGIFAAALAASLLLLGAAVVRRSFSNAHEWLVPLIFFVWPLLYFTIGTASFSEYLPPVMQARYYAPCMFPAVVVIYVAIARSAHQVGFSGKFLLGIMPVLLLLCGMVVEYNSRGISYWARAKDSFNLALADTESVRSLPFYDAGEAVNTEVHRCKTLLLRNADRPASVFSGDESDLRAPFLVTSLNIELVGQSNSPLSKAIERRVQNGEWKLGMIGYYFADEDADDELWWLPRQAAVVEEFKRNPARFKEPRAPVGYTPWMKREMHAEVYVVLPAE